MSAFGGDRAGGLRLIRIVLVAIACGTMINTAGGVFLFVLNADRVDQINEERARNTVAACNRDAGQNRAILAFLRERGATAEMVAEAEKFFPVRSPGECARLAREQVSNP